VPSFQLRELNANCSRVEARTFSSLAFEPVEGSPLIDKGG
jgi:hypothetical protein